MQLKDKAALITGAASGIGLAIAERFAAEGAAVVLVDQDAARGEIAAAKIHHQSRKASFVQANLAEPVEIVRAVQTATERCGRLDILVNNAATFLPKVIEEISVPEWDFLMAVNLRAPFLLVQAALPALKAANGTILNISSTAGIKVFSPNLPYSTAKAGLITMTKSLAQELHPHRIRVNCLCPGAVDTPALHRDIEVRGGDSSAIDGMKEQGYLITPEQIAAAALHLVSDESGAITGSIVVADAGAMLA
ncbi:MAG: SDR family oxidoreductase [Anaerolineaceae bacterium]|nr:SDR family oxidoreductase [Anaerolineaceae bacterium]